MGPLLGQTRRTALRVTAGPAVGKLIVVDEELQLGRGEEGEGALGGDEALSDAHALLSCDHMGDWMVRDLGSETGTLLNGQPLAAFEQIHRGDMLRLGESRLLVVEGPPRPPGKRAVAPPPPPVEPPTPTLPSEPQVVVEPVARREPVEPARPPVELEPARPVVPGL